MFKLIQKKGKRRLGVLKTPHGEIFTPAFGPDATRGLIKHLSPHEIIDLSGTYSPAEIFSLLELSQDERNKHALFNNKRRFDNDEIQFILSNTYHLRSYPGDDFIREMGGLHKFMSWPFPILTDSGGFQVFSLIHKSKDLKGKVNDDGAFFNNPINGDRLELTPEKAIDIQFNLGSDIMVVLDDCRHYQDLKSLKMSVYRTIEWAKRSKAQFQKIVKEKNLSEEKRPLLFCVIQGGIDYDLRKYCVDELVKIGFDGYGFGGWAINEKEYFPYDLLEFVADRLPEDKPRYAMGVGNPENLQKCVDFGYDLFDCVIPSRNGRHGLAYTTQGTINIKKAQYKSELSPLDPFLKSSASHYSMSYLHHLFKIQDPTGGALLTIHNLKFFNHTLRISTT